MDVLLQILAKVFIIVFLIGVAGSMVVVVVSFVEDLDLLIESDDENVDGAITRA